MNAGGRRVGRTPLAQPATADLFEAAVDAAVDALVDAPVDAPASPAVQPLPRLKVLRAPGGMPPDVRPAAARLPRQLWYAVVFHGLASDAHSDLLLQRLGRSAQRFTSLVSIEMPNALLLELQGSVKLFGNLHSLHADLDATWQQQGLEASSATAPTTLAALWCARVGKPLCLEDPAALAGCLAELPVACTAWTDDWLQTLNSLGVRRLGELLRLPRAGLARRLSPAAVRDLDIALARQAAPRRAFVPRERFRERGDFEFELETVAYLHKALGPVLARCVDFLRTRQAGVQSLQLKLRHRTLPATRLRLGLAGITGEHRRLADVLEHRLTRLVLAAPVRGMELSSGPLQSLSNDSLDAFAGLRGAGRDTAPQLVERLRARLGTTAVYGVCCVAEHRPEAAWQRVQELRFMAPLHYKAARPGLAEDGVVGVGVGGDGGGGGAGPQMPRPVWLLEVPLRLSDALILEQGPERIESGWWDGKGVTRDYYIARQARGARWWVFQERKTRCWYLHGVFA